MNEFQQELSKIKASDALKEKTRRRLAAERELAKNASTEQTDTTDFLKSVTSEKAVTMKEAATLANRTTLEKSAASQRVKRRRPRFRSLAVAMSAALVVLVSARVYATPVNYLSVDVNPSIELGLNRWNQVVSTTAYNKDGAVIVEQLQLKNKSCQSAIEALLQNEAFQKYLTTDADLTFTTVKEDEDVQNAVAAATTQQSYTSEYYVSTKACMEEAHAHHMSVGKYAAYERLSQLDGSVTVEECQHMSMEEIHSRIQECEGAHSGSEHGASGYGDSDHDEVEHGNGSHNTENHSTENQSSTNQSNRSQNGTNHQESNGHHGESHE